ncbi:hypothetical protein Tco_1096988, partial [Tanacetum coccineum]
MTGNKAYLVEYQDYNGSPVAFGGSKGQITSRQKVSIARAKLCTARQKNFDAKKQFLMYPRFVQVFLNNQLSNLPAPLDNLPIPVLTKKDEGLGQPTEPQPTPSPIQPSTTDQTPMTESSYRPDTTQDPRVNLEGTSGSQGDQVLDLQNAKDAQAAEILKLKTRIKKLEKKCKPSISHHRAWLKSVSRLSRTKKLGKKESVSKQGRKNAKPGPTLDAFDDLDADLAHVIAKDKGSGEKGGNIVSTARPKIDTARPDIDTARLEVHTTNALVSTTGVTIST